MRNKIIGLAVSLAALALLAYIFGPDQAMELLTKLFALEVTL